MFGGTGIGGYVELETVFSWRVEIDAGKEEQLVGTCNDVWPRDLRGAGFGRGGFRVGGDERVLWTFPAWFLVWGLLYVVGD